LKTTTPWPYDLFTYNEAICYRDVGLIIDGVGYDIVLGTNYHARRSGLSYRLAAASVVNEDQVDLTVQAIEEAHDQASSYLTSIPAAQSIVESSKIIIANIVRNGGTFAPALTFTNPVGLATNRVNASTLLQANLEYIQDETVGYLTTTYPSLVFNQETCSRDVGYIIEAVIYDIIYGGNSETRKAGIKYYDGVGSASTLQIPTGQLTETIAGINYAKYLAKQVILSLAPTTSYSATARIPGAASDSSIQAVIETLMADIATTVSTGTAPTSETLPSLTGYSASLLAARSTLVAEKADIQQAVIDFVNDNANVYEVLMPGNRSMLSNDYTQINDLGYGIVVNNGGLAECVSMFTYYCHISYYSLGGGQIRSIGGSSAHGNFALVAEGSDPLEVPTPVSLYYDLAQSATCYAPSGFYETEVNGLIIYVTNFTYPPLD